MSVGIVKKALHANGVRPETISKNKDGHIVCRTGFFYRNGKDSKMHTERISNALTKAGVKHEVVDSGEHWAPFRGGASTARSSHWYTHIKLHEDAQLSEENLDEAAPTADYRAEYSKGIQAALRLKLVSQGELAQLKAARDRIYSGNASRKDYETWDHLFGKVWDIITKNPQVQASIRSAQARGDIIDEGVDAAAISHRKAVRKAEAHTVLVHQNGRVIRIPKHKAREYLSKGFALAEEVLPGEGMGWHKKKAAADAAARKKTRPTNSGVLHHLKPSKDVSHLSLEQIEFLEANGHLLEDWDTIVKYVGKKKYRMDGKGGWEEVPEKKESTK